MNEAPMRVLLVNNDEQQLRFIEEWLRDAGNGPPLVATARRLSELPRLMDIHKPEIVACRLQLPDSSGLDTLRSILDVAKTVPVVVLADSSATDLGIQALQMGAADFLTTTELRSGSLLRSLCHAMERHRLKLVLMAQSYTDNLTQLHNRNGFLSFAQRHLDSSRCNEANPLLLYGYLNGLVQINAELSKDDGDDALREAAHVLRGCFRNTDVVARLRNDEFAALVVDAGRQHCSLILDRINRAVEKRNASPGRRFRLSLTCRFETWSNAEIPFVEGSLQRADKAIYDDRRKRAAQSVILSSSGPNAKMEKVSHCEIERAGRPL